MLSLIISKQSYAKTIEILESKFAALSNEASFFVMFETEYDSHGNVVHDFFDIIHYATTIGYEYVNTIVYPTKNNRVVSFNDNVRYVVWLCKSQKQMYFDKDIIREKHIWKDVEWGKREKNYNPKGKDPGNVWIPTEDDGKANITAHILLSDDDVINRIKSMSDTSEAEYYIDYFPNTETHLKAMSNDRGSNYDAPLGKVIFGTSENMRLVSDSSIRTIITSPPYWNLKDYFKDGQIGQESYDTYLSRMSVVWNECYKKLCDDGTLWININIRTHNGKVILIPYDFIIACKNLGFFYKGIIIWHKSSGIPTSEKNIVDRHEFVLLFSKKEDFVVNFDAQKTFCDYKNDNINSAAFWNINRKAGSVGKKFIHPAIYPNELVKRTILLSSKSGDTVLDPFLGSGTSLISAVEAGRNFIGYEYNEGFKELMDSRFSSEIPNNKIEYCNEL
jgi:DNA modification methylase